MYKRCHHDCINIVELCNKSSLAHYKCNAMEEYVKCFTH